VLQGSEDRAMAHREIAVQQLGRQRGGRRDEAGVCPAIVGIEQVKLRRVQGNSPIRTPVRLRISAKPRAAAAADKVDPSESLGRGLTELPCRHHNELMIGAAATPVTLQR
jgi:hypothetical protein